MTTNIHKSLLPMAVAIESLSPLENNPRVGNIDAITASYSEFGQVKPIVAKKNSDGTATVIAGNHQLEAAKKLGWDKIAVIFLDADDNRAIAYALADNRTMELGYNEPELLIEMIMSISESYPELLEEMGWDEFEIASYESDANIDEYSSKDSGGKYVQPTIQKTQEHRDAVSQIESMVSKDDNGENIILAGDEYDQKDLAIRGSTTVVPGAAPSAAVQVPLVFDNTEQQKKWYAFVKWLRSNPSIDGNTTGQKLLNFIDEHCEVI